MARASRRERAEFVEDHHGYRKLVSASYLAAIILGVFLLGSLANAHQSTAPFAPLPAPQLSKGIAQLPDGKAKSTVVAKCQLCHSLERVVVSHLSKEAWRDVIDTMIERGAPVTADEAPIIVDYLSASFGPAGLDPRAAAGAQTGPTSTTNLIMDPNEVRFSPAPNSMGFPNGIQISIVSGDPSKAGLFSMLLKVPAGQVILGHWLSGDESIVCLRGTLQFGEGNTLDAEKLQTLNPGAVLHIPNQTDYFLEAKDLTIILVYGDGPLSMTSK